MYQIDKSFTRLAPAIDFFNSVTDDVNLGECLLGSPSERLLAVHCPALIQAWHARLVQVLSHPAELETRKGHRRVGVLGTAVFDFDATGLLQVYGWDFDENDRVMLKKLPAHAVVIQGTPYQIEWMQRFQLGALRALQQRHPGQSAVCLAYVAWAQTQLEKRLWTTDVQERVRYQVSVALDLDMEALGVVGQMQRATQPRLPMRADVYNHAVCHAQDYATLHKEAPQLIPLYALLADEAMPYSRRNRVEVTAWMQHALAADGIEPAMWRLLCQVGTGWMKEFLAYYRFNSASCFDVAIDILRVAQAFGTQQLVPAWLLRAFIQLGGNPNAPVTFIARHVDDLFPLCKRLGHLLAQADAAAMTVLQERAQDIFGWASDHLVQLSAAQVRRATLHGLIRRVDEQHQIEALQHQAAQGWGVPYQLDVKLPDVQAVILDSPLAIWQEGKDMRHCARHYIALCQRGSLVMVALRHAQRGKSLATVTFAVKARTVTLHKISGFANALVPPEVRQMAQTCQQQLQAQCCDRVSP